MSTLKTTYIQHPDATGPAIELTPEGTMALPLSGIGDLADVDEGSGAADGDVLTYDGVGNVWVPAAGGGGFDASETITASNASWPVPSLANPVVKVTVIGGGGGGSSCVFNTGGSDGGQGGTTTFDAGGAGTLTATGGLGGKAYYGAGAGGNAGNPGTDGASAGNGGQSQARTASSSNQSMGNSGNGGSVVVGYLDLTGITTVNVTIGAGGTAGSGAAAGGRGEVIVEYKAA